MRGMHALITGTSSGIGAAVANALAAAGYDLTLVARRAGPPPTPAMERVRTRFVPCDLADLDALPALVEGATAALGEIDVLVNNAGVTMVEHTDLTSESDAARLMRVDLLAPLALTRLVLPSMKRRRAGTIVDVASVNALAPTPFSFHYNAAKAGLAAASEGLRADVRPYGVHVITVYPGPIKTPLLARAAEKIAVSVPRFAEGTPEGLAARIARGIARREGRIVYPRMFALTELVPSTVRWSIERFYPRLAAPSA
jgi:short-subunit dehydrogenase